MSEEALSKFYDKISAAADEALPPGEELSAGEREIVAEKMKLRAAEESIDNSSTSAAEKADALAAAADDFRAAVAQSASANGLSDGQVAESEEFADDVWDGVDAVRMRSQRRAFRRRPSPAR